MILKNHTRLIRLLILSLSVIVCCQYLSPSQSKKTKQSSKSSVSQKQSELEKLNKSISITKSQISSLNKKEQSEARVLNRYRSNLFTVNQNLRTIETQIRSLQDSINYLSSVLTLESKKIDKLKKEYSRLAGSLYMSQKLKGDNPLLHIKEISPLDKLYLKWLEAHSIKKVKEINNYINSTELLITKLDETTEKQEQLRLSRESERTKLNKLTSEKSKVLKKIRADKVQLTKELKAKEKSAKTLKSMIGDLIKKQSAEIKPKQSNRASVGKLRWPTSGKAILKGFGESIDPSTKLVFDNPGIDIKAGAGSKVFAAGAGSVSTIHWLPGYGSLIIIDHGGNLRTVYANLSRIFVKKGDKVTSGAVIGESGESLDGECLHFEVWQGSMKMNPMNFLR